MGIVIVIFEIISLTSAKISKPIKKKLINLIDLKAFAILNILLYYIFFLHNNFLYNKFIFFLHYNNLIYVIYSSYSRSRSY